METEVLRSEDKIRIVIDLSNKEFVELFNEIKKNELTLAIGMSSPTPLTDIGKNILEKLNSQGGLQKVKITQSAFKNFGQR